MDTNRPSTSAASAEADLAVGTQVGEYVVQAKIGEGGFGAVFRAEHPLIGKMVAIKVLSRQYSADPAMVERFVAEARAVNQIRHRNMIDIFGFGQLPDGRSYYVMEFLEGQPLDEVIAERGRLHLIDAIPILRAVGRALDAAHQTGIAHRDLKPENVFLARDSEGNSRPKLLDFGIAKLLNKDQNQTFKTRTGAPIGTPYYMSPEQCRGREVDHRTDIYAFGCMSYRLVTGCFPFDGEDYMDILMKQLGEQPRPVTELVPDLPPGVQTAISWMLEKDPAKRPPNLASAVAALEDAAKRAGIQVPVETDGAALVSSAVHASAIATPPSLIHPSDPYGSTAMAVAAPTALPGGGVAAGVSRGRTAIWLTLTAVVLAAMGLMAWTRLSGKDDAQAHADDSAAPAQSTASTAPAAAAADAAPPEPAAPVEPPPPSFVTLDVRGAPAGTEVYGPLGPLGVAPGKIQLPFGDVALLLTFKARGFETTTREVVPNQDGELEIEMASIERKRRRGVKRKGRGERTGNKARDPNSIEDPF